METFIIDAMLNFFFQLSIGDFVCLRSFPIYHAGAIAVNVCNGLPKVGKLLQSVWQLEAQGTFQVLRETDSATEG